jgi:hypothetical protein
MKKIFLFLNLLTIFSYSQEEFSFNLAFEDSFGNRDTLNLGYDPISTDSIDLAFGEVNINGQVWNSSFEARTFENYFVPDTSMLKRDIRPIESYIAVLVKFNGSELYLSWDSTLFNLSVNQGSSIDSDLTTLNFLADNSNAALQKSDLSQFVIGNDTLHMLYVNFSGTFSSIDNDEENKIEIFPNPTTEMVDIIGLLPGTRIMINDAQGRVIEDFISLGDTYSYSFSGGLKGIYFVTVIYDGAVMKSEKVIFLE